MFKPNYFDSAVAITVRVEPGAGWDDSAGTDRYKAAQDIINQNSGTIHGFINGQAQLARGKAFWAHEYKTEQWSARFSSNSGQMLCILTVKPTNNSSGGQFIDIGDTYTLDVPFTGYPIPKNLNEPWTQSPLNGSTGDTVGLSLAISAEPVYLEVEILNVNNSVPATITVPWGPNDAPYFLDIDTEAYSTSYLGGTVIRFLSDVGWQSPFISLYPGLAQASPPNTGPVKPLRGEGGSAQGSGGGSPYSFRSVTVFPTSIRFGSYTTQTWHEALYYPDNFIFWHVFQPSTQYTPTSRINPLLAFFTPTYTVYEAPVITQLSYSDFLVQGITPYSVFGYSNGTTIQDLYPPVYATTKNKALQVSMGGLGSASGQIYWLMGETVDTAVQPPKVPTYRFDGSDFPVGDIAAAYAAKDRQLKNGGWFNQIVGSTLHVDTWQYITTYQLPALLYGADGRDNIVDGVFTEFVYFGGGGAQLPSPLYLGYFFTPPLPDPNSPFKANLPVIAGTTTFQEGVIETQVDTAGDTPHKPTSVNFSITREPPILGSVTFADFVIYGDIFGGPGAGLLTDYVPTTKHYVQHHPKLGDIQWMRHQVIDQPAKRQFTGPNVTGKHCWIIKGSMDDIGNLESPATDGPNTGPGSGVWSGVDLGGMDAGDTIMIAVDPGSKDRRGGVWFGKNGSWPNGDPKVGGTPDIYLDADPDGKNPVSYFPGCGCNIGGTKLRMRWGNSTKFNPPGGFSYYGVQRIDIP